MSLVSFYCKRIFFVKRTIMICTIVICFLFAALFYKSLIKLSSIEDSLDRKIIQLEKIIRTAEIASIRAGDIKIKCSLAKPYLDHLVSTTRYINGVARLDDECYSSYLENSKTTVLNTIQDDYGRVFFKTKKGRYLNPIDNIVVIGSIRDGAYSTIDFHIIESVLDDFYYFGNVYFHFNSSNLDAGSSDVNYHHIEKKSSKYPFSLVFSYRTADILFYDLNRWVLFIPIALFSPILSYFFLISRRKSDTHLICEIKKSIKSHHFIPYLQPIIGIDGRLVHAEVLVRWEHPKLGVISPGEFISAAEKSGLIIQITDQIMNIVARELSGYEDCFIDDFSFSFNISSRHLESSSILASSDRFLSFFSRKSILCLELTEREVISNDDMALSLFRKLKLNGVKLALDDFGTGYASLETLLNYEFDIIKIDKSFVDRVGVNSVSSHIVDSLILLAKKMEMVIIVEGVETERQLDYFCSKDVDAIQGFYYSKPLSVRDFTSYLQRTRD